MLLLDGALMNLLRSWVVGNSYIGHTLLPIFYHIDPSDVRGQIETFAEAFARLEGWYQTDMARVHRCNDGGRGGPGRATKK
jgi:hypothetical protein